MSKKNLGVDWFPARDLSQALTVQARLIGSMARHRGQAPRVQFGSRGQAAEERGNWPSLPSQAAGAGTESREADFFFHFFHYIS